MATTIQCPKCKGNGGTMSHPCSDCHGSGTITAQNALAA